MVIEEVIKVFRRKSDHYIRIVPEKCLVWKEDWLIGYWLLSIL